MSIEAHGLMAWGFSPGSVSDKGVVDTGVGICVAGGDAAPSVSVYSDGEQVIGMLVFDSEGNKLAGWGHVPAWEAVV